MARSAIAFAFLALAAASGSTSSVVEATSRHLLQAPTQVAPAASAAASGSQSTQPFNLPPGVTLTAPDGSAPQMPSPVDDGKAKVAAVAAAAEKDVVDQHTMKQFQAVEAQRDAARSADPSTDPLNAPRDDVLKTVTLPTADELKKFAESEQVKSFREALAAAPALPAVAAPKFPFASGAAGGGMAPPAPPKPAANKPAPHAQPHSRPNAFASKHKAPEPPKAPEPEPEAAVEEEAADDEVEKNEVETAEDGSDDGAPASEGPHVIDAKVVDVKQH